LQWLNNRKVYKWGETGSILKGVMYTMQVYTITKRISKHGSQAVITIPKLLEKDLKPGTIAEVKITVIKETQA